MFDKDKNACDEGKLAETTSPSRVLAVFLIHAARKPVCVPYEAGSGDIAALSGPIADCISFYMKDPKED